MIGRLEAKTLNKPGAMHQPLHGLATPIADQSETDCRFEVLSKGNCGQSSCAAKHRPTDQNEVLENA